MTASSDDYLDRPRTPALIAYLDHLPEPVIEPSSRLPVWALKLVEHHFAGGDLAAVPGAEPATAFEPEGEREVVDVAFEGVLLRFYPWPDVAVQTFVTNDAPGRPAATADGAGLAYVLMFEEDAAGPHAFFEFEGVVTREAVAELTSDPILPANSGVALLAVDDGSAREVERISETLATTPSSRRGSVCFVAPGGAANPAEHERESGPEVVATLILADGILGPRRIFELETCPDCGERRGHVEAIGTDGRLAWSGPLACACEGPRCSYCGDRRIRLPASDRLDPDTGEIFHTPWYAALVPCGSCQRAGRGPVVSRPAAQERTDRL